MSHGVPSKQWCYKHLCSQCSHQEINPALKKSWCLLLWKHNSEKNETNTRESDSVV